MDQTTLSQIVPDIVQPGRVLVRSATTEALDAIRRTALDPKVLDEFEPYLWSAQISSTAWDSYDTRMAPDTLENFVKAAQAGVSVLRNHDPSAGTWGYSYDARFVGAQGNGVARAEADFYSLQTPDKQTFIVQLRGGEIRDVSVGFFGGVWECSICGRNMLQWFGPNACYHMLGMTYTPRDEAGATTGEPQVARATIKGADLSEVSTAYDGSTPGAMVQKARTLDDAGLLSGQDRRLIAVRYNLPGLIARSWPGSSPSPGDDSSAPHPPPSRGLIPDAGAGTEAQKSNAAEGVNDMAGDTKRETTRTDAGANDDPPKAPEEEPEEGKAPESEPAATAERGQPRPAAPNAETRLRQVEAELRQAREDARKAAEESAKQAKVIAGMQEEAQRKRFRDVVLGIGGEHDGLAFPGEPDAEIKHLMSLAATFGEDSDEVRYHIDTQRKHAEVLQQSGLLKEIGTSAPGKKLSAAEEVEQQATKLASEKSISKAQARVQVRQADPALRAREEAERAAARR